MHYTRVAARQTRRKSCSAVALLRAEQGLCEPCKDFVSKFGELKRARGSTREPEIEPERTRKIQK